VPFEVDPDVRNGESEVDITIQPGHPLSPEAHDGIIVGGSEVTTLFDVQSYAVRGRLPDDDVEQPLDLRGARCEQHAVVGIEERTRDRRRAVVQDLEQSIDEEIKQIR
jgi:hypothetical protein